MSISTMSMCSNYRLRGGYRGQAAADEHAFTDALLRVSALLEICPEIHDLDINPL